MRRRPDGACSSPRDSGTMADERQKECKSQRWGARVNSVFWTWTELLCSWTRQLWLPAQDRAGHHSRGEGFRGGDLMVFKVMAPSRSAVHHRWPHTDPGIYGQQQLNSRLFFKDDQNTLYASIKCSKNKNIQNHVKCWIYLAGFSEVLCGSSITVNTFSFVYNPRPFNWNWNTHTFESSVECLMMGNQ